MLDFLARMNHSTLRHEINKLSDGAVSRHFTPPPRTAKIPQSTEVTLLQVPEATQNHPASNRFPEWLQHRGWDPDLAELTGLEFVVDGRGQPRVRFPFRRFSPANDPCFFQDRAMFSTMSPKWMAPRGAVPCPFEAWRMKIAQRTRSLIVCEGLPDVMALLHVNPNLPVIGIPGAGAFKAHWCRTFRGLSHIVVIADNDKAGSKLRDSLAIALDAVMLPKDVHQLFVPDNFKDVDDWRQADPASFPLHFSNVLAAALGSNCAEGPSILGHLGPREWGTGGITTGTGDIHGSRPLERGHPAPGVGGVGPPPRRLDLVRSEAEDREVVDVTEHRSLCNT